MVLKKKKGALLRSGETLHEERNTKSLVERLHDLRLALKQELLLCSLF